MRTPFEGTRMYIIFTLFMILTGYRLFIQKLGSTLKTMGRGEKRHTQIILME